MTNFGTNFSNGMSVLTCPFCKNENSIDSEEHTFNCDKMIILIPNLINEKFTNIYSNNIKIMNDGLQVMTEVINLRNQLLE